jgi:hypothetical protein
VHRYLIKQCKIIVSIIAILYSSAGITAEIVKMSKSGICHDSSSSYYSRTKSFTAFDSLQQCLDSGGRLTKEKQQSKATQVADNSYDRDKFNHWIDSDHDCLNTRHELLLKLSTGTIDYGKNKCLVESGKWLDPYTGKTFYNSRDLDVDHLIPLKWAWLHGADSWTAEKRKTFANDDSNLFAVELSVNRQKGAKGPLEWLPPNEAFQCQYTVRFKRIALNYGLEFTKHEAVELSQLQKAKCGK